MNIQSRKTILASFDLLAFFLTIAFAYSRTLEDSFSAVPVETARLTVALMASAIFCVFYFSHKGHYGVKIPWWQQVRHVLRACILMLLGDILLNYVVIPEVPGQRWIVLTWLLSLQNILLARWVSRYVLKRLGQWDIPAIVVGGAKNVSETLFALKSEGYLSYAINRVVLVHPTEQDVAEFVGQHPDIHIATDFEITNKNDLVVICPDNFDSSFQMEIMEKIKNAGVKFAISPPTSGLSFYGLKPQYYFGYRIVLLESSPRLQTLAGKITKGLIDRGGALVGLILLSPLFLILAYKVRQDGGSAFYGQRRIGQNGKEFKCWKFRSMIMNADEVLKDYLANNPEAREEYEKDFKLKNDPRITKVGHILRKTSLDEIPQLFNVLIGEMSLVGPRPIVQAETHYYQDDLKYYLAVKPGITGLWQVSGRNDISYAQRVSLDAWYVENWSVWNDIVIVLKTIYVVLVRKGAY